MNILLNDWYIATNEDPLNFHTLRNDVLQKQEVSRSNHVSVTSTN